MFSTQVVEDVLLRVSSLNDDRFVTQSAGLLSYTFLIKTGHEDIVVPMVSIRFPFLFSFFK